MAEAWYPPPPEDSFGDIRRPPTATLHEANERSKDRSTVGLHPKRRASNATDVERRADADGSIDGSCMRRNA
jgi:hypothetical protein